VNKRSRTRIAVVCLGVCAAAAAHAVERVAALHSDIRIAPSGELRITETIELQTGPRDAHSGIVREFASDYRDRAGNRVRAPLVVDKVLRNGRPEPYALEREARAMRLRTGQANRPLARGKHVFEISYRTARQVGFSQSHDELYWDVGGGWPFAFERLSAEVSFERPVPAGEMKLSARTGRADALGEDYHAFVREGSAAFRATRPLGARERLAIVVGFPKGVVAQPTLPERAAWYLAANPGVPVGGGIFAAMLAFLLVVRIRLKRADALPATGAVPEGVGPAGVRFIARNRYDERCLAAALLGLQSRGFLRLHDYGERLRLERTGAWVDWLPGEEELARRLFRDEDEVKIRRHGRTLEEAGRRLSRELRRTFLRREWSRHGSFVLAGAGIGALGILAMVALEAPHVPLMVIGGASALSLLAFAFWLLPVCTRRGNGHRAAIEALRGRLAEGAPESEEERSSLEPYAFALDIDWAKGLELSATAQDKAPERPMRPLRHSRSAAA
jgi:hypothetical protein